MAKGEGPVCPCCGTALQLLSIRCGRNAGRTYRCGLCQWKTGDKVVKKPKIGAERQGGDVAP